MADFPSPPTWPLLDESVRDALLAAWADGSWGQYAGRHTEALIAALEQRHDAFVYPCCSGTFAVELALRLIGVGSGDEVILAGYDFGGNFRAIEAVGARPVLIDIVPQRWHLDPMLLADAASPQVKAVLVSHLHGVLAPLPAIMQIAEQQGWSVLEDACQASGASLSSRAAGTTGHVGTLSFGGSKLLIAGRGGAVLTRDAKLLQRAKVFCEQGNHAFPLSELQAAVLLPQLGQLTERHAARAQAVRLLRKTFSEYATTAPQAGLRTAAAPEGEESPAFYKLGWLIEVDDEPDFARTLSLREKLVRECGAAGIGMDVGFRGFGRRSETRCRQASELTHARRAAAGTLVLHHPQLLASDERIVELGTKLAAIANRLFAEETT